MRLHPRRFTAESAGRAATPTNERVKIRLATRNWLAVAGWLAALAAGPALATDQALLDALVRKAS